MVEFFEKKVLLTVEQYSLIKSGDRIIVAVSGGSDSVALLFFLNRFKIMWNAEVIAIHINHLIREDSFRDENFVKEFCNSIGVECLVFRENVPSLAREKRISVEECGRIVRYDIFKRVLRERDLSKIATAHHLDDNVETFFLRIFKGTSLNGLKGILPRTGEIIRPFIYVAKSEIMSYVNSFKLPFVSDETNFDSTFERNFIRNEIISLICSRFPKAKEFVSNLMLDVCQMAEFLDSEVQKFLKKAVVCKSENSILVSIIVLKDMENTFILKEIIRRIFKDFLKLDPTRKVIQMVIDEVLFGCFHGNKIILETSKYRLIREYYNLRFELKESNVAKSVEQEVLIFESVVIQKSCDGVVFRELRLKDVDKQFFFKAAKEGKFFISLENVDKVVARYRKEGDYMFIDEGKRKKLKNILIDEKVPLVYREKTIVLENGQGDICLLKAGSFVKVSPLYFVKLDGKALEVKFV